ncbi:MAG: DUF4392 domain-containing protein [Actinobacteria bacterium]|nr:DUF4392 domain-containing protein [Actinomycetota bacterium]
MPPANAVARAAADVAGAVYPYDYRGLRGALRLLPPDGYARAAEEIVHRAPGLALLVTGFPVNGVGETDGPPGARALGGALAVLGWGSVTVACPSTVEVVRPLMAPLGPIETVTAGDPDGAAQQCDRILAKYRPDLVLAIERPGRAQDGRLVNMRGEALIGVPVLDPLLQGPASIGIGDGGNELGLGRLARYLSAHRVVPAPCTTAATHALVASVSNWGAYGLLAMLEILTGASLVPTDADDDRWVRTAVAAGAVDGLTRAATATVDAFGAEHTAAVLAHLRRIVRHAVDQRTEQAAGT